MKFHCKRSLSSPTPPQHPSGEHLLPSPQGRGDADAQGGTGNAIPAPKAGSAPASASSSLLPSMRFQQRGFCPCTPPRPARQRPQSYHGAEIPRRGAEGPGVTGHSPGACTLALGQSPAAGTSRRYGKNKESVPAITGFSNMANHAIFTGAYLFSEDAGTDSRVSFFSPAVFKDRFELALFKGFASCPLFLTPCTSLCIPPLLKTKQTPPKKHNNNNKSTKTTRQQHSERKPTKGPSVAGSNHHFRRYC